MREKLKDQGYDREEEFFRKQEREAIEKMRHKKSENNQEPKEEKQDS